MNQSGGENTSRCLRKSACYGVHLLEDVAMAQMVVNKCSLEAVSIYQVTMNRVFFFFAVRMIRLALQ